MSQEIIDELFGTNSSMNKALGSKLDQRDNSPEFKMLGFLHPQSRTIKYPAQDNQHNFRSQPKYSYSKKTNLKLFNQKRDKLGTSPVTYKDSPRSGGGSPRVSGVGLDQHMMNLRKKANNTEIMI